MNFDSVLRLVIVIAAIFTTLPGVSLLVGAITNALKAVGLLFGISFDGHADQVTAWLNLIFFLGLIALGIFSPAIPVEVWDGKAKLLAESLIALTYFFGQLKLQPMAHAILRGRLPLIGTSYNK